MFILLCLDCSIFYVMILIFMDSHNLRSKVWVRDEGKPLNLYKTNSTKSIQRKKKLHLKSSKNK